MYLDDNEHVVFAFRCTTNPGKGKPNMSFQSWRLTNTWFTRRSTRISRAPSARAKKIGNMWSLKLEKISKNLEICNLWGPHARMATFRRFTHPLMEIFRRNSSPFPSYRYCKKLGNFHASQSKISGGFSGLPPSPHTSQKLVSGRAIKHWKMKMPFFYVNTIHMKLEVLLVSVFWNDDWLKKQCRFK